jgi:LysR family transcriptional regulator, regulator for bpeEF and oprC
LPRLLANPEVQAGRLVPVLTDWDLPRVPVHAVFASARYLTPKVRAFIDLAVQAFDRDIGEAPAGSAGHPLPKG